MTLNSMKDIANNKTINLKNRKISVLGMGKSGLALAQVLSRNGASVFVSDSKTHDELSFEIDTLNALNVEWEVSGHTEKIYDGKDLIVISPGISIYHPIIVEAKERGVPVISEVEMAYRLAKAPFIAITGTNGKSTTTTLTHETLLNAGKKSFLAGNIGIPLVGEVENIPKEGWITSEISSFQLEAIETFKPKIAALLNITMDHLDRHKTFDEYAKVKAALFQNQFTDDFAVFNADDPAAKKISKNVKSQKLFFSRQNEVKEGAFYKNGYLVYRFNGRERTLFSQDSILLKGIHNQENALAVVCIALAAEINMEAVLRTFQTFKSLKHRMEYVDSINGVDFYNDSKGTNPDAVRASLESFSNHITLIAGGTDKNLDFSQLARHIKQNANFTILIGQSREKIAQALNKEGYTNYEIIEDMSLHGFKESIRTAFLKTPQGGTVLLSPSCASFDMFKRAEHRGEMFNQYVGELKAEYENKKI